jgi:hypothetical protein
VSAIYGSASNNSTRPALERLRVDAVGQAPEMHLVGFEAINQIDQPFDAATQAIELPDDKRVTRSCRQ